MSNDHKFAFLIGAPKAGTTAMADWLARHPEIFTLPGKEPGFFRSETERFVIDAHHPEQVLVIDPDGPMRSEVAYSGLAAGAEPGQWLLDGSTDYLSDEGAPARIRDYAAGREVRIICILRDPVERAFSEYRHTRRDGLEPLSFRGSIEAEEARKAAGYQPLFFHVRRSRFHADLTRYIDLFGADRVLILDHDALKGAPVTLAQRLFAFLEIAETDLGQPDQLNVSEPASAAKGGLSRAKAVARALVRPDPVDRSVMPLSEADRRYVFERLEDDIRNCVADDRFPTDSWASRAFL